MDEFEPAAIVILNSHGGLIDPALRIAEMVRESGATVVVPRGAECDSACALIWIAARHRKIERGGAVGFHAVSLDPQRRYASPDGDDRVASRYERWGLSQDFIQWAQQWRLQYLTPELAQRFGIQVEGPRSLPGVESAAATPDDIGTITDDIKARFKRIAEKL